MTTKLAMNVSSRNENDDGGCVLACIDLTRRLAELALQRIESLREPQSQDPDADEVYYWNYHGVFFDPFHGPGHEGLPEDPWALTGERLLDRLEREQKASSRLIRCSSFPSINLPPSTAVRWSSRRKRWLSLPFRNTVTSTLRR